MLKFFINNPVFSSVIAIIIVICGLSAIFNLPLEEYPNISPPTITLSAKYPGANADVLSKTIASPIEDAINGANSMIYMDSTLGENGDYNLIISFALGTDLNQVIGDVLNRLNNALPKLPEISQNLGVSLKKSSQNLLMSIALQSVGSYDLVDLSNYVNRTVVTELARIKGIGDVTIIGASNYAMRIWLNPIKMAKLNIGIEQIKAAIKEQNIQAAIGKTGYPPTDGAKVISLSLNTPGYYTQINQFENIIIKQESGSYLRIKDVATVTLGAQSYDTRSKFNQHDSVNLQIYLSPAANQLAVHSLVLKSLTKLALGFPRGINYQIAFDNTKFVQRSLNNVIATLIIACTLVSGVIFLFLQKFTLSLIPIITIPVAIIGTFAGMYLTNFSINNLTLFALVLAIGIVVDDSIVVIENVERVMTKDQLSAKIASIKTMKEVARALISIVLVLCAAFIPSAFLGGLTGVLYQQFALTISIAVIISGVIALTLTPALCAVLLDRSHQFKLNKFFIQFNHYFLRLTELYLNLVKLIIKHAKASWSLCLFLLICTIIVYHVVPVAFIPNEDRGYISTQITLNNNATLNQTESVSNYFINALNHYKLISDNSILIGVDQLNSNMIKTNVATVSSNLIDWSLRKIKANTLVKKINQDFQNYKFAKIYAYSPAVIIGVGGSNALEFYLEDRINGSYQILAQQSAIIIHQLSKSPLVATVSSDYNPNNFTAQIIIDSDRAKFYQVDLAAAYNVLATNFAPNLINYFYKLGGLFWVIIEGDPKFSNNINQLSQLYVKNNNNKMISLAEISKVSYSSNPGVLTRFNSYLAAKIILTPHPGISNSKINQLINQTCKQFLTTDYNCAFTGISYLEDNSSNSANYALIFAIIMIFLVLAAQFEMWRLPLVIILAIPFALLGAGLMLLMRNLENDLYFQISLITLLGLSAKNSILIVEFAINNFRAGLSSVEAVLLAVKYRFRPIIMTSIAFILGALPLMFATGANSQSEHSVASGIIGGMLGSTFIATLFIPLIFVLSMGKLKYK